MRNPTRVISRKYLIHEAFLFLTLSYLVFFGSSKSSLVQPVPLIIDSGLVTLIALYFILQKPDSRSGIDLALGLMMIVMLLASLTSIDPRRSLSEFGLVGFGVCLFLLVSDLVSRGWDAELVVKTLLLVGAILMAMSWFEVWVWYRQWLGAYPGEWLPSINYRLPNPNFLAVIFNLWLMAALARLVVCRSKGASVVLGGGILSAFGLIYLTSSRGGWLGTAAGLACLGFILLRTRNNLWQPIWQRITRNRLLLAAGAPVILISGAAGAYLLFRQMTAPSHGSRTEFWTPALRVFLESPILGKGPFTFISAYLRYNSVPPRVFFDYAHSIYMDLLSGTGLLGMAAFLFLVVMVIKSLLRSLDKAEGDDWGVVAGALAALAAFCVHGLVDSVHHTAPISLWFLCVICAAALGGRQPEGMGTGSWLKTGRIAIALAVTVLAWLNVWMLLPYHEGVFAAEKGDWGLAAQKFTIASRRDAHLALAYQQRGMAESMRAVDGEPAALGNAIIAFEEAVAIDPDWALNHANLGALLRANGDLIAAEKELKLAVNLAPGSPLYQLNLGISEENPDSSAAIAAYQQALNLRPLWAESNFWIQNPLRKEVLEMWTASQVPRAEMDEAALRLEMESGSMEPYLNLAKIYLKEGNLDEAEKILREAALVYTLVSDERFELDWLNVELIAASGEQERACDQGDIILNEYINYGIFGPGSSGSPAYAIYMFRRPAIGRDFVPQMEVILLPVPWEERANRLAGWCKVTGNLERAENWRKYISSETDL